MSSTQRSLETRKRQERDQEYIRLLAVSLLRTCAQEQPLSAAQYFEPVFEERSLVDILRGTLKGPVGEKQHRDLNEAADRVAQAVAAQAERMASEAHKRAVSDRQERERYEEGEREDKRRRARASGRA